MGRILLVSIVVLSLAGCGSKGGKSALSGKVTYKGQPVNGASLFLIPMSGEGKDAVIPVTQEGTFNVSGIPQGEYKVVVKPAETSSGLPTMAELKNMPADKRAKAEESLKKMQEEQQQTKPTIPFPDKYKTHMSSDLKLTVGKAAPPQQDLELKD